MKPFLFFLVGFLLLPPAAAQAVILDRIIAVVNDEVVTLSELKRLEASLLASTTDRPGEEDLEKARERLLDELVDKKIKLQKAKALKIEVSDEEVNTAIEQILSKNKVTREAFRETLQTEGFSWSDYKTEIRDQMVISRLLNQEVRSKIILMPGEVESYYETNLDRFGVHEKKRILRILLALPEAAETDVILARRKEAEEIHHRALSGENFRQLAARYSDGPEAGEGGDLGFFAPGELRKELDEEVSKMGSGDISPVIELGSGFAVLKVDEIKAASHIPLEKIRDDIEEALFQEKLKERYETWIRQMKETAYIERKL